LAIYAVHFKLLGYKTMLGGSHVTTERCILRLRMEEKASRYGG